MWEREGRYSTMSSLGIAWRRIHRNKSASVLTLLILLFGAAIFTDSNVTLSSAASQTLENASASVYVDITVSLSQVDAVTRSETSQLADRIQSVQGVTSTESLMRVLGTANAIGSEESPVNVTIVGVSNETHYFDTAFPIGWTSNMRSGKCYVSSGESFYKYAQTGQVLSVNFTVLGTEGFRKVGIETLVESSINLTRSQESITRGIFEDNSDSTIARADTVIFIDYGRLMSQMTNKDTSNLSLLGSENYILISVDRTHIDALQIDSALFYAQTIDNAVSNLVASSSAHAVAENHLIPVLRSVASWVRTESSEAQSLMILITFLSFYLAFFSYRISYKRRRRQFGLMRTHGFSRDYVGRVDIVESLLMGVVAGLLGFAFGTGIVSLGIIAQSNETILLSSLFAPTSSTLITLIATILLSTGASVVASYVSMHEMASLSIVDQLREPENTQFSESPHWNLMGRLLIIPAFFQIVYDISGLQTTLQAIIEESPGTVVIVLLSVVSLVISWLRPISPIILCYGLAVFITMKQNRWKGIVARLGALFSGSAGALLAKCTTSSARKSASLIFILTVLIVLALVSPLVAVSQFDHDVRDLKARVGSDVSVGLSPDADLDQVLAYLATVDGIEYYSVLHTSTLYLGYSKINVAVINQTSWIRTAYIEDNWFEGSTVFDAMTQLVTNSCLCEIGLLSSLDSGVGDTLPLSLSPAETSAVNLTIAGALRVEPYTHNPSSFGSIMISATTFSILRHEMSYSTRILLRLMPSANETAIIERLKNSGLFSALESAKAKLNALTSNPIYGGLLQIRIHTIIFAYLLGSIGIVLISSTYANELRHDLSVLYLRGLPRRRRARALYTSFVVYIVLSLSIGLVLSIPIMMATIAALNSTSFTIVPFNIVPSTIPFLMLSLEIIGMLVSTYLIFWYFTSGKSKQSEAK